MRIDVVALAAMLALSGCSTRLTVTRVEPGKPETHVGIPHPLMFSRYETKLRWQVADCGASEIKLKVGAEFKDPVATPDADNLFVIDPASLAGPLKSSELLVEYHPSGAPASLNAKATDSGAQVLAGIASIGAGLVKLKATQTVAPLLAGIAPEEIPACSCDVVEALESLSDVNNAVKSAAMLADERAADLKALSDKLAVMGNNADAATKQAFSRALDALGLATTQLNAAMKAQAKVLETITYEQTEHWPPSSAISVGAFELPAHIYKRWTGKTDDSPLRAQATVHLSLQGRDGVVAASRIGGRIQPELGIPVRLSAEGSVSACLGKTCASGGERVAGRADRILQLGGVFYLPCVSGAFSSMSCSYSLDEHGRLKSMGSTIANAAGESLSGAINDVLKQAIEARQTRREAKTKQIEADTAYLKAKIERDAAEAAISNAQLKKADTDATAALLAQAERLNAQRALLEAELALAETQAKANKP